MEENKYICPICGSKMLSTYEKPALNLTCSKCGCKIATTKWEEIDLDEKIYKISITPIKNPNIEQIKFVSKLKGWNFIKSKQFLINGGKLYEGQAIDIFQKREYLENYSIVYSIIPFFKY